MRIRIRGKYWKFLKVPWLGSNCGKCEPPDSLDKTIRIERGLRGLAELDTTIHEVLHAAFWDLDEAAINESATDLAKILWKLGWRKP